jgi:hypothetical protein
VALLLPVISESIVTFNLGYIIKRKAIVILSLFSMILNKSAFKFSMAGSVTVA